MAMSIQITKDQVRNFSWEHKEEINLKAFIDLAKIRHCLSRKEIPQLAVVTDCK
jgi:hypothetical protein